MGKKRIFFSSPYLKPYKLLDMFMINGLITEWRGLDGEKKFAVATLGSVGACIFLFWLSMWLWAPMGALISLIVVLSFIVVCAVLLAFLILCE